MYFKTLVSENSEIYVIYSNPEKTHYKENKSKKGQIDKIEYGNDILDNPFFPYKIPIYIVETNKI